MTPGIRPDARCHPNKHHSIEQHTVDILLLNVSTIAVALFDGRARPSELGATALRHGRLECGYGGVLANMDDDKKLKPLAFKSAHYNEQGQRRASVAREAFCSGCLLHHWRWCLLGAEFTFISIANV